MSVVEDSCPAPDVPEAVVKQVEERNMLLKAACKQTCMNIDYIIRKIKNQLTSIHTLGQKIIILYRKFNYFTIYIILRFLVMLKMLRINRKSTMKKEKQRCKNI